MDDYQSLLDQYSAVSADSQRNYATPFVETKPEELYQISADKADRIASLTKQDALRALVGRQRGVDPNAPEMERDMATMSPIALYSKYGPAATRIISLMDEANGEQFHRQTTDRSTGEIIGDTGVDAIRAVTNTAGGLLSIAGGLADKGLGAAGVHTNLGGAFARGSTTLDEFLKSSQSDGLNARRVDNAIYNQLADEENKRQTEADLKKDSSFLGTIQAKGKSILRDGANAIDGATQDADIFGSDLTGAAGSMLAVGPLAKGVRAIVAPVAEGLGSAAVRTGVVSPFNELIPGAIDKARALAGGSFSVPASIGLMEAASTYPEVSNKIMGMSDEDLMKGSPIYRDLRKQGMSATQAKETIANDASLASSVVQGIAGAASGRIVSKFEGNWKDLLGHGSPQSAIAAETLEEGLQNATQQLAENAAVQHYANKDQDLTEGVGGQTALGALYGGASAGVMRSPQAAGLVIRDASVGAGKAALAGAKALAQPLIDRGADFVQSVADRSPVSLKSMAAAANIVMTKAPQVMASIKDAITRAPDAQVAPEDKAKAGSYVEQLFGRINVDPSEIASMPVVDTLKQKLAGVANRFDLISKLASVVQDKDLPDEAKVDAAIQLHDQLRGNDDVVGQGEHLYDTLEKLPPEGHQATPELLRLNQLMSRIKDVPVVKSALEGISSLLARAKLTPDVTSPENVSRVVGVAEIAPQHLDPDVADTILMHEKKGDVTLTPEQVASLKAARDLARANLEHQAATADLKSSPSVVTDQIRTGTSGQKAENQPSAVQHYKTIVDAMRRGDTELAQRQMGHLTAFAQTLQNKVAALNDHLANGDGTQKTGVRYQNYTGQHIWRESASTMSVDPTVASNVDFAQRVHHDARAVTDIANGVAKAYPKLGFKPMDHVELHPELQGNLVQVSRQNAKLKAQGHQFGQKVSTNSAPAAPVQEQAPAKEATKEPVKMKVSEMLKASETEAQLREQDAQPELALPEPEAKPTRETAPGPSSTKTETNETTVTGEETPAKVASEAPLEAPVAVDKSVDPQDQIDSLKGHFGEAFKVPTESKSRLLTTDEPVAKVTEALSSPEKFEEFAGTKPRGNFTPAIAEQYQEILGQAKVMSDALIEQLNEKLNKVVDGKTIGQHILDGTKPKRSTGEKAGLEYDLLTQPDAKALNLLREVDGKLEYDPKFVESAVLAGIQWSLAAGRYWSEIDAEKASKILDIPVNQVEKFLPKLRGGLGLIETKQSLANMIQRFWGVTTNRETDEALSKGITESVAGEILHALEKAKLIGISKFRVTRADGLMGPKDVKDIQRFMAYPLTDADPILAYTTAIEEAVINDPEPEYHVGEPPKTVARTQMNNPRVENTENAKAAIEHENKTPYYANVPLITLWQSLGESLFVRLFGEPNLDKRKLNQEHAERLRGQNLTLTSSLETVGRLISQVENWGQANNKPVEETPVHFAHNMSKVGRMQQLGKNSPQASKVTREVYLPMRSTLDLTTQTGKDFSRYGLGLAQALGIKVHALDRSEAVRQVLEKLEGDYAPAVDVLSQWHDKPFKLSEKDVDTIRQALGGKVEPMGFHALFDYARYRNADEAGRKAHSTQLYVEADGVANGISNAMLMVTHGLFDEDQIRMMAKSGVFLTNPNQTMNGHRAIDSVDTYSEAARHMNGAVADLLIGEHGIVHQQVSNISDMLELFDAGVNKTINQETGDVDLEYDRGLIKNPATITIYGSGEKGIAGNIVGGLLEKIYERMSAASEKMAANPAMSMAEAMFGDRASPVQSAQEIYDGFTRKLAELSSPLTALANGNGANGVKPVSKIDLEKFKVSDEQFENMQKNVHQLFVKPLRAAISTTVGDTVMQSMDAIRTATQVQGIFLKYAYQAAFAKAMEGKGPGEGLSPKEQDALFESLKDLVPVIETGKQSFYPAGSEKADVGGAEFGRSLSGKFRTDAYTNTPENPGVRGMPMMIIGSGDGFAMQTMATLKNAVDQTLKIFDGVNMALHNMEEGSRQANQAAFTAMMNNPVGEVLKAYKSFLAHADFSDMSEAQRKELVESLFGLGTKPDKMSNDDIKRAANEQLQNLETMSRSIEARHNVLSRATLSVDQMAAVGEPHLQKGEIDLAGMTEQEAARTLNKAYAAEYAQLSKDASQAAPEAAGEGVELKGNIADTIQAVSRDGGNGVRTISQTQLKRLLKSAAIPGPQKTMLNEIVQSLSTKGYRIVAGTLDNIRDWTVEHGLKGIPIRSGNVEGYISFGDKVIYTTNGTSETLTHELIHASTFEKLVAYYKGGAELSGVPEVQVSAIKRIEALANQFIALGRNEKAIPVEAQNAYADAVAAMQEHLRKGTSVSKAAALNEFMAWSLSNEKLSQLLSQKEASPLARLAKAAIDAIKKIIWGNRAGLPVANDMLSNLQFNTGILVNSVPTVKELIGDTGLFQHQEYGRNERLAEMTETFERKVTDFLNVPETQQKDRNRRYADAMMVAQEVGEAMRDHFPMDMQEAGLHQMVVAALATQAELDPNSLDQVAKLYEHVLKHISPESFMPENSTDPDVDRHYAQLKFDAIVGNLGGQKDTYGRSTLMSNFLGLSMVNEDLRKVLREVPVPKAEMNAWDSVDHALENVGTYAMDWVGKQASGADRNAPNVQAAMDALTNRILEVAQDRTLAMDALIYKGHGLVDQVNDKVIDAKDKVVGTVIEKANKLQERTDNKLANTGLEAVKAAAALLSEKHGSEMGSSFMKMINSTKIPTFMHELANEIIGRTKDNSSIYDMIKLVRARVQQLRQQFREEVPEILRDRFSRQLKKPEWTHLFKGLAKTDLAALQGMTNEQIVELLKDQTSVAGQVTSAEEQVSSLAGSNWQLIQKKAKDLAHFMNTGQVPHRLLRNARAIASLHGEGVVQLGKANPSKALVNAIDHLVSLYALDGLNEQTKSNLTELAKTEGDGIAFLMSYLKRMRNDELSKVELSDYALENHYKGYIPSEAALGAGLVVANVDDEKALIARGYRKIELYKGSKAELGAPQKAYYFSPVSGRGMFNAGILQNVRATASGVDPKTGFTNVMQTAGQITDPGEVNTIMRRLAKNDNSLETLMPIYNSAGETIAYERAMDPLHDVRLGRNTNLADMIGAWHGRQIEEEQARIFNRVLGMRLKNMWERDKGLRKDEYVNLFSRDVKDPITRDAVSLMGSESRDHIESLFGKNQFWVRKDMLNDVIGYRNASIGDSWTGISRWPAATQEAFKSIATAVFGDNAYRYLMMAERTWQNLVTDAKVLIVIKSIIVPMANLADNFFQLLSRGVPVNDIVRGMIKHTANVQSYMDTRKRLIEAQAELHAADGNPDLQKKLKGEIQTIEDAHKRLAIWPLIAAGEFSAISDVGISHEQLTLAEGRLSEYMERLTDKLPPAVHTLGRYAIVSRDTALFKGLQRATEYGDFLAKATLYEHLMKKKGQSHSDALKNITEEFVNYDRMPGRVRSALESNGLMWFWNFKLRSTKVALSIIRNNPVHTFLSLSLPGMFGLKTPGSPIFDNAGSVFFQKSRLAYSLGMDQMWRAHLLNPFFNLID